MQWSPKQRSADDEDDDVVDDDAQNDVSDDDAASYLGIIIISTVSPETVDSVDVFLRGAGGG